MGAPDKDAGRTVDNGRDEPEGDQGTNGPVPGDPLQERIAKLEARLADMPPDPDAHVNALYGGIRSLVGELIRRRRQAEQTCETLTRVLEATSDAFVALDADWRYTYVNAHAGQLFNRDPASLIDEQRGARVIDVASRLVASSADADRIEHALHGIDVAG